MDFTEVFKQSHQLVEYSSNGLYIATAVGNRLVVRESSSLQIVQLYNCSDAIQGLAWSPCSSLLLVYSLKLGLIQVFSLAEDPDGPSADWTCKVDEGLFGLSRVIWSPSSRHFLSFSDYQLRITIWSLLQASPEGTTKYLQYPKYSDRGYAFRSDGKYFCMAERIQAKDYLSIFDTSDWELQKRFPIDTGDVHDLAWSPDGRFIAVWDSWLHFKVLLYRPDGRLAGSYTAADFDATQPSSSICLGIKKIEWSPSAQFLAVGSFDQKCRLLNHYTWKPLLEFDHPRQVSQANIKFYKEIDLAEFGNTKGSKTWSQGRQKLQYEISETPCSLPAVRPDPEKPNPKMLDSQPLVLWIWDVAQCRQIAVIQQTTSIKTVQWNPLLPDQLAFCTGNGLIYLWEAGFGCDAVEVPAVNFNVLDFKWNPDGKSLALLDRDKFCLSFVVDE
ncbi:WD repeat-containing protein wrap73 [Kappamyces sp. JEL0829]|nr:WD repeat-containing protein wrap73 [Kappamyces sp. JEL0829]